MNPVEEARRLVEEGWYQVSRGFFMVAKLPEGKTGKQALFEATCKHGQHRGSDAQRWVDNLGERHAGDHYLRCYAHLDGNTKTVGADVFEAFRKLGGGVYTFTARKPVKKPRIIRCNKPDCVVHGHDCGCYVEYP